MRRRLWWIVALLIIIGAPIGWYLGSPLFINRTVVEEFPEHIMAEPIPSGGSVAVRARGAFMDADGFHKGSGTALLIKSGGQLLLRLEDFRVTNGPDLYVYLSSNPSPRTSEQVHEGVVNLGRLKGNIGAQNYAVPAGTALARVRSVVIYCQRFHVLFATATLQVEP